MTNPERKTEVKLRVGEMPTPRYIKRLGDTNLDNDGVPINWVGMEAYSADREIKRFLWWKNVRSGNINKEEVRTDAATAIARLKLGGNIDAAIGLPIDLGECDHNKGFVKIIEEPDCVGIYIEENKRSQFSFDLMMGVIKLKSVEELKKEKLIEFHEAFQKARIVLPRLKTIVGPKK